MNAHAESYGSGYVGSNTYGQAEFTALHTGEHSAECVSHAVVCAFQNGASTLGEAAIWAHGYLYEHTADGPDGVGICKCTPADDYTPAQRILIAGGCSPVGAGDFTPDDALRYVAAKRAEWADEARAPLILTAYPVDRWSGASIIPYGDIRAYAESLVSTAHDAPELRCSHCGQTVETYEHAHDDAVEAVYRFIEHTAYDPMGRADILTVSVTVLARVANVGE